MSTIDDTRGSPSVLNIPNNQRVEQSHYATSYNFQQTLHDVGVDVTAIVRRITDDERDLSYPVHETGETNTLAHRRAERELVVSLLRDGDFDIYHQQHLPIHSFSPTLLTSTDEIDQPIILGPLETGHTVPPSHFKSVIIPKLVGRELPDFVGDTMYPLAQLAKRGIQPLRDTLFRKSVNAADCVVFPNHATKSVYEEQYLDASTDTAVIPYGIRYDEFTQSDEYSSDDIVCVGRLSKRKGQAQLIRAMPAVLEAYSDARLVLIGKGILRDELEELAADLNVNDSVDFLGYVSQDELERRLSTAGVFAHPSRSEGYFFSRLEAMACARPVVGTALSGADEITTHGETGYLFEPGDIDAIAEYCVDLLTDDGKAEAFGQRARRDVEDNHDWTGLVGEYLDLYEAYL